MGQPCDFQVDDVPSSRHDSETGSRGEGMITELALVRSSNPHAPCRANFSRIEAGPLWDGDFAAGSGSYAFLCAGSGGAAQKITNLTAVAASSAAGAVCPEGFEPVPGNFGGSNEHISLCFTRDPAAGAGLNALEGRKASSGCPAGLLPVSGHRVGPVPNRHPNATACHGFVCLPGQQDEVCPKGAPGAADRDYRCCDLEWLEGPHPGSPAPQVRKTPCWPRSWANCSLL
jgi:hypothetical protein